MGHNRRKQSEQNFHRLPRRKRIQRFLLDRVRRRFASGRQGDLPLRCRRHQSGPRSHQERCIRPDQHHRPEHRGSRRCDIFLHASHLRIELDHRLVPVQSRAGHRDPQVDGGKDRNRPGCADQHGGGPAPGSIHHLHAHTASHGYSPTHPQTQTHQGASTHRNTAAQPASGGGLDTPGQYTRRRPRRRQAGHRWRRPLRLPGKCREGFLEVRCRYRQLDVSGRGARER